LATPWQVGGCYWWIVKEVEEVDEEEEEEEEATRSSHVRGGAARVRRGRDDGDGAPQLVGRDGPVDDRGLYWRLRDSE